MKILFITGHSKYHTGGAEIQAFRIAAALKKLNHEVAYLSPFHVYKKSEYIDDIKVEFYRTFRFLRIREFLRIKKKLKQIQADAYYLRAVPYAEAGIVMFANKMGIPLLWQCPSGRSLIKFSSTKELFKHSGLKRIIVNLFDALSGDLLRHYTIKHAQGIVAQTHRNSEVLQAVFNRSAKRILKGIEMPAQINEKNIDGPLNILFIRNIRERTRLHYFIDVAEHFKEMYPEGSTQFKFCVIGKYQLKDDKKLYKRMMNADIEYQGQLSNQEVLERMQHAHILIDTLWEMSDDTTYSTAFIEAWSRGVVVISFGSDPDGVLSAYNIGYAVSNVQQCIDAVKSLNQNRNLLKTLSDNTYKYVSEHHDIEKEASDLLNYYHEIEMKNNKRL